MRHHLQIWKWNAKGDHSEMPLILGRSGTQYVAMVTKLLSSNCGVHLVESYCKESNISDTNWLRYLFSSYLIKFGWVYDVIIWLLQKLEYLWNKKRYFKIINSILLLTQATCLCFKMTSIKKDAIFVIVATKSFQRTREKLIWRVVKCNNWHFKDKWFSKSKISSLFNFFKSSKSRYSVQCSAY